MAVKLLKEALRFVLNLDEMASPRDSGEPGKNYGKDGESFEPNVGSVIGTAHTGFIVNKDDRAASNMTSHRMQVLKDLVLLKSTQKLNLLLQ